MAVPIETQPMVLPEHDRIQSIVKQPGWAENLVFEVNDGSAGLAVWCHWGRIPGSPEVWEGVIAVYLPGGDLLVSRSFGTTDRHDAASSGPLTMTCLEPNQAWHVRFDGMARRASSAETAAGPLPDGPVERLLVDLEFEGLHPTWSAHGAMTGQTWATAHLEQAGRVTGTVSCRQASHDIEAFGFRDHSYGPRDYSGILGDTWCTGVLPDGRAMLVLHVWQIDGPAFAKGFVWDGARLHPATESRVPRLAGRDAQPHRFDLEVTTDLGTERIAVEQTHCMTWTMEEPSALAAGAPAGGDLILCTEGPARLTWDGQTAHGWIEKTLRPSRFAARDEAHEAVS